MQVRAREVVVYCGLAIALLMAPLILFHHAPTIYAHVVAEDFAGEYATAVAFTGAALLFFHDAIQAPARARKAMSLLLALVAVFVAGEEVSWGQRQLRYLFGFSVPEPIRSANFQEEMNLHNLEAFKSPTPLYPLISYMLLGWIGLSAALFTFCNALAARVTIIGIPLVPLRLVPVCILPAFFFLLRPVAKADEVGELLVGVAALTFAVDRAWSSSLANGLRLPTRAVAVLASLIAVAVIGLGLAAFSPLSRMAWRLEALAARDYPSFGMYEQAETLFDHIYAHPTQLLKDDTRLSHAEVLVEAGELAQARGMLALAQSEHDGSADAVSGAFLRRVSRVHSRLGDQAQAEETFAAALAADERALEAAMEPDERAQLLLSLARTLSAQGALDEAVSMTRRAQQIALSSSTRRDLRRFRAELDEKLASASPSSGENAGTE